jgi:enolase
MLPLKVFKKMKIKAIKAFEILDSRGTPTIATFIESDDGLKEFGFVPSGASTGSREAIEKRDNGKDFNGKGVSQVIKTAEENLFPELIGMVIGSQVEFDSKLIELDATKNKKNFGANIILSLSLAYCKLSASTEKKPLYEYIQNYFKENFFSAIEMKMPLPMMNILNGGAHANNKLDFQEFMIQPVGFSSFKEGLICGVEIFNFLKKSLNEKGFSTAVGDEGGFAPGIDSAEEALDLISSSIQEAGYEVDKDVTFALDCAATELLENKEYVFSNNEKLSSDQLIKYLAKLAKEYPITSVEDGLDENDWIGWKNLTQKLGKITQLVGDDLFVTNKDILQEGIDKNIANSVLVKINQIGTISETYETISLAYRHNYKCIISHRSGETEDNFIADLAVGTGAGQIKTGAPSRSDRTSKYNRLLMIDAIENLKFLGRQELVN